MQNLGEDLVTVLDQLRIKYCIGIGDGAGSNIIVRFVRRFYYSFPKLSLRKLKAFQDKVVISKNDGNDTSPESSKNPSFLLYQFMFELRPTQYFKFHRYHLYQAGITKWPNQPMPVPGS